MAEPIGPDYKNEDRMATPTRSLSPEAQIKGIELVWGNPVIFGIMVLGVLALAVICIPYAKDAKDIIIPAMSGIGGLAGGVAISKLSNK